MKLLRRLYPSPSLSAVLLWICCQFVGLAADRPNVLLILTDDQGYGDFGIHGHPFLQTPSLDQLARQGVQFERFYVNSFCAPTRAGLLTGRWPLRTGCHGVTHNRESMRAEEVTIAELLQQNGYRTACIGKWHNGEQYPLTPAGQGFEHVFGFNNGHWNNYFDATLLRGHHPQSTSGYITDVLTDEAIRFVEQEHSAPFFCYLSFNAPHSPYQVPEHWYEPFRRRGLDERLSAFFGMCASIDHNVGRLLERLQQSGRAENTIVVFLTDNGGTAGVRTWNAGMRGGKTSVHEGGSRVPLFIRWPAANWSAHTVLPICAQIDLLPTLCDLCGVTVPDEVAVDGRSLRPLLEAENPAGWPDRTLFTHNPIDERNRYPGAVRTQRWRMVREIPSPMGGSRAVNRDAAAGPWQLFDMQADPGQKQDVAVDYPAVVRQLSLQYETWIDDISSNGLERLPLPVGHAEHNPVELHAPQAWFDAPLHFAAGPGYANDWLTNWSSRDAAVWFDLDVQQPGEYAIQLAYGCSPEDAGSEIRVQADKQQLLFTVPAAPAPEVALPHRDEAGRERYRNRRWATIDVGTLRLQAGPVRLELRPTKLAGNVALDLKHVRLERL